MIMLLLFTYVTFALGSIVLGTGSSGGFGPGIGACIALSIVFVMCNELMKQFDKMHTKWIYDGATLVLVKNNEKIVVSKESIKLLRRLPNRSLQGGVYEVTIGERKLIIDGCYNDWETLYKILKDIAGNDRLQPLKQ